MISNQLLRIVLSTHNLESSRSTLLLFKIFNFQSLQVWTRFVKFGEIHISSSPKILPKFRQPPDAMRGHPTKNQLKENSPHAKIISSNTWPALFLCTFRKFSVSGRFSVVFVRVLSPIHSASWRVAHSPFSLARAPHAHLDGRRRRWWRASPTSAAFAVAEPPVAANRNQR